MLHEMGFTYLCVKSKPGGKDQLRVNSSFSKPEDNIRKGVELAI